MKSQYMPAGSIWLLVATSRSLLLIDPSTGTGFRVHSGKGIYGGITTLNGLTYVAARGRLMSSHLEEWEEDGEILVLDQSLRPTATLRPPFPLRGMHQILGHAEKLWVTCTYDNMIAIFDGQSWDKWYPRGIPEDFPKDENHFNSLSVIDEQLCVVAHNKGESELLLFALPALTCNGCIKLGIQAHNAWKQGDQWMTCSSNDGKIVSNGGLSILTGGFPRGITFANNITYVGISQRAERWQRDFTSGSIMMFDVDWKRLGQLHLSAEGLILDLMACELDSRIMNSLPQEEELRCSLVE